MESLSFIFLSISYDCQFNDGWLKQQYGLSIMQDSNPALWLKHFRLKIVIILLQTKLTYRLHNIFKEKCGAMFDRNYLFVLQRYIGL